MINSNNIIYEAERLINSTPDEDVGKFGDNDAMSERIREWLDTPMGSVADNPGWGNNLSSLKFDPTNIDFDVSVEFAIVGKLPQDVEDLVITGIRVIRSEIDLCHIYIRHEIGEILLEKNI